MLVAKNQKGHLITAYKINHQDLTQMKKEDFYCPLCSQKVILKAGQVMIPHYAHESRSDCPDHQGETEAHLNGKLDIYRWCQKYSFPSTLEYPLQEVRQRIDVVARIGKTPVAFEYQCSPISLEEFQSRTEGIRVKGFLPIWIFGDSYLKSLHHNSFRLSPLLKTAIMTGSPFKQSTLLFYSSQQKRLTVLSNFYTSHYRSFVTKTFFNLKNIQLQDLIDLNVAPLDTHLKSYWLHEKKRFRSMQRKYFSDPDKQFMSYLYRHFLHPQYLPACVHLPTRSSHRLLTPNYVWQTHFLLDFWKNYGVEEYFTWSEAYQSSKRLFTPPVTMQYPSVSLHPLYEYLQLLTQLGYFKKTNQGWQVLKHPRYPKTLDEALIYDRNILQIIGNDDEKESNSFLSNFRT